MQHGRQIATSSTQTATQALNAAGEETTSEQFANFARHYFTFHHNTRNFQKQTYGCRNASGSEKSFRHRRKLRRNGIRRTKGTNSTETTTGLQIRPRTVEQSFRHTMGTTTEHLQPSFATPLDTQLQPSEKRRSTQDFGQQTNATDDIVAEPATKQQRTIHHLHNFRLHRRQVHDHYRVVLWLLHQPDDNIHHYQHHLDKH